jgi:hypothetical protein
VNIAVTKNGKPNLDVKRNWIETAATSCGIKDTGSGPYPAVAFIGSGFF